MKVQVIITLKKNVLDPQGKVIQQTLDSMGFNNISEVRQGKFFEIEIDEKDQNVRKTLNLGHTFGHAIESDSKNQVSH